MNPLDYLTPEQFAYLLGLAGIGCGLIFGWVVITNT